MFTSKGYFIDSVVEQVLEALGSSGGAVLETDGVLNVKQSLLNLKSGSNVTLTPDSNGGVSIAAGGGGSTPRLDQVLDPTADKTFDLTTYSLVFQGAVVSGLNDPAAHVLSAISPGSQFSFSSTATSLAPFISLGELNDSAPTLPVNANFAGANIMVLDSRASGNPAGLVALQIDADITGNINSSQLVGINCFVWQQGGGVIDTVVGMEAGIELDSGTVSGDVVTIKAATPFNFVVVGGNVIGMQIMDQSLILGPGTSTGTYGLKIEDQVTGTPWAIKTGLGLVELGGPLEVHGNLGFFAATPAAKQTVAGAKLPADAVIASLLTALAAYGLITDSTT